MYKVGDKFEIEIAEIFNSDELFSDKQLYRIKGFNSLVFDEIGMNKLKRFIDEYDLGFKEGYKIGYSECEAKYKNNANESIKTVKASELAVDTKVICWDNGDTNSLSRRFATLFNGCLYAYYKGYSSKDKGGLILWEHMTLEDGTVVLPE